MTAKTFKAGALCLVAIIVMAGVFSSCVFLDTVLASTGVGNRVNAEIASATGLTAMNRKIMFNVVYAQVYYVGGFNPSYYELAQGQGTTWRVTTQDGKEAPATITTERALLKKNADGTSWWYLTWAPAAETDEPEGQIWAFEALMDKDMNAQKIRYFNADTDRVEEAIFTATAKPGSDTAPPAEAASADMSREDLSAYRVGKENVTVGAGTFNADKYRYESKESDGKTYSRTWWVGSTAPGGLVKYEWISGTATMKGELIGTKKSYTTRYSSY